MNCPDCKHYPECTIVNQIEVWEREVDLEIEGTPAAWVMRDMRCKSLEQE